MELEHSLTTYKNKQTGPNHAYMRLHSKGHHKQNEKTIYGMGENTCKWCDWQGN